MELPLAKTKHQLELWDKLTPVLRTAASDTYKRTMSGSSSLFADHFSAYYLAARRPLQEEGANGRLIVAGLEKMLYPWFMKPIGTEEIEESKEFFKKKASVQKFADAAWQKVIENDGFFPIDIYALPGGQTILAKDGKHVPIMSIEGPGALVSHLEPHLEHMFAPMIQATKARLFSEVTKNFAEFGLRSDISTNDHVTLLMALYVGGGFTKTSNDMAVELFPEYFKDIGTIAHEFIMAYQKKGRSLEEAQHLAYEAFIGANERSALLPDVIHTLKSGLPEIMREILAHPNKTILPRLDSGDVIGQLMHWIHYCKERNYLAAAVVEDGYNPTKARETIRRAKLAGMDTDFLMVGAGGYFWEGTTRDAVSLADKRSATMHESLEFSIKLSDTIGKGSLPGQLRVYDQGNVLMVAMAHEKIDGIPLMVPIVKNGRITYFEDLHVQHARANATWNKYDRIEYSAGIQQFVNNCVLEKNKIIESLDT